MSACTSYVPVHEGTTIPHHGDGRFVNPYSQNELAFLPTAYKLLNSDRSFPEVSMEDSPTPRIQTEVSRLQQPADAPQVLWIGHSTVLIQYQGINILTDPIFSDHAAPFRFLGFERYTPPSVTIEQLPDIDYVLISHNHYDHLDSATVGQLGNTPHWLVPLGLKDWFADRGVDNVSEFDWWDELTLGDVNITATPSQHWSSRGLFDRLKTLWASWAVQIDDFSFWFAGDTGYNPHQFREIGNRLGPFDFAMIPIGGYDPRWFLKDKHVNPEEAVLIHNDVGSKFSMGIHWGTFILTLEPVLEPMQRLQEAATNVNRDTQFIPFKVGEIREIKTGE